MKLLAYYDPVELEIALLIQLARLGSNGDSMNARSDNRRRGEIA